MFDHYETQVSLQWVMSPTHLSADTLSDLFSWKDISHLQRIIQLLLLQAVIGDNILYLKPVISKSK